MSDTIEFPRPWKFHSDEGDADGATFLGRFTGNMSMAETSYGPKPVAQFVEENTGEEISVWMFNAALLDQLSKVAPEKGELVKIDYHGKKVSKTSGRKYASYKVTAPERPVQELSWASLGVPEEEETDE